MNGVGLWTFGRQVRTKVHGHLSHREVVTKLDLSFLLSLRPNLRVKFCPGVLYHSIHDNNVLSAILQTGIEINLPILWRPKDNLLVLWFWIHMHVLNLETYWWFNTRDRHYLRYHVTCQSICCAVPLTRSRPIAVEQNGRDNTNNVDKSGRVAVKKVGRVLHLYPKIRKTK